MKKKFMAALLFMASVYASESVCAHVQKLYVSNLSNWSFTLNFSINGKPQSYQFDPHSFLEIGPISSITHLELSTKVKTTSLGGILGGIMGTKASRPEKDAVIEVEAGTVGWIFATRWEALSEGADIKWRDSVSKTLPVTRHKK